MSQNKIDKLAEWITSQAESDTRFLEQNIRNGTFNLTDHKLSITDEITVLVFFEFLFMYFNLVDLHIHQKAPKENRDDFMKGIVQKVVDIIPITNTDFFAENYNDRMEKFGKYKKLLPDFNKGEIYAGTLFWEFGVMISEIIEGNQYNISLILGTKYLVVVAYGSLPSLNLFSTKENIKTDRVPLHFPTSSLEEIMKMKSNEMPKLLNLLTYNITQEEYEILNKLILEMELGEMIQVQNLISNCNISFQFAKTHSAYVNDWEKTKQQMDDNIKNGILPQGVSVNLFRAIIDNSDMIIKKKLKIVQDAFFNKFGESIFNYLGKNGKIKVPW